MGGIVKGRELFRRKALQPRRPRPYDAPRAPRSVLAGTSSGFRVLRSPSTGSSARRLCCPISGKPLSWTAQRATWMRGSRTVKVRDRARFRIIERGHPETHRPSANQSFEVLRQVLLFPDINVAIGQRNLLHIPFRNPTFLAPIPDPGVEPLDDVLRAQVTTGTSFGGL